MRLLINIRTKTDQQWVASKSYFGPCKSYFRARKSYLPAKQVGFDPKADRTGPASRPFAAKNRSYRTPKQVVLGPKADRIRRPASRDGPAAGRNSLVAARIPDRGSASRAGEPVDPAVNSAFVLFQRFSF
jgi:hypothetical protein